MDKESIITITVANVIAFLLQNNVWIVITYRYILQQQKSRKQILKKKGRKGTYLAMMVRVKIVTAVAMMGMKMNLKRMNLMKIILSKSLTMNLMTMMLILTKSLKKVRRRKNLMIINEQNMILLNLTTKEGKRFGIRLGICQIKI